MFGPPTPPTPPTPPSDQMLEPLTGYQKKVADYQLELSKGTKTLPKLTPNPKSSFAFNNMSKHPVKGYR